MVRFQKICIFEMRIKNLIEWTTKMSKIWEKNLNANYCKFLLLPFKCESEFGPEKPDDKRNIFTLWQEFSSQYWGQIQMNTLNKAQILKKQLCKLCGKEVHGRNTHIREKHSDGDGNYKCPKCDLVFRQYFLGWFSFAWYEKRWKKILWIRP